VTILHIVLEFQLNVPVSRNEKRVQTLMVDWNQKNLRLIRHLLTLCMLRNLIYFLIYLHFVVKKLIKRKE